MNTTFILGMADRAEELNRILLEQGAEFKLAYTRVWKNNRELEGYVLKSENSKCSPTIYHNPKWYDKDDLAVIDFLTDIYKKNSHEFDINKITDREYILANIKPRLVSDRNLLILDEKKIAHVEYLDMLVVFYIPLDNINNALASVQVSEALLRSVNISVNDALNASIKNIEKDVEIKTMMEVLCRDLNVNPECIGNEVPMWVVSTKNNMHGAAAMLCKSVLESLQEKVGGKVAILPSSIHECIAVKYDSEQQFNIYRSMVKEVNSTQVEPAERLTDSVYFINNGTLKLAV